jgi:hypothetical protein
MLGWLEVPDDNRGQVSKMGGGEKIINQESNSVKNITMVAEQFLYNSIDSRLGKEARHAGLARSYGRWG